jgi:exonuclease III
MKGIVWNIRGLNHPGRKLCLDIIKNNRVDFVGIQETKKEKFHLSFLKNLTNPTAFSWNFLPAIGTAGGILLGTGDDALIVNNFSKHTFSVSCVLQEKVQHFSWKLIIVYGPVFDDKKVEFIDELHHIMSGWQGPVLVGRDFNLCREVSDKSNGRIKQGFVDYFND